MSNIKEREKFDAYEMEDEYDFSGGIRGGGFTNPKKYRRRYESMMILCYISKRKQVSKHNSAWTLGRQDKLN
ncbi:MAG: hypothetical protein KU38_13065 [Sulfurovum sp. FS08-3]|nr:MAG: hypothetical protein KU38_13065 [Sulfurovum sp. FS08-3]